MGELWAALHVPARGDVETPELLSTSRSEPFRNSTRLIISIRG